MAVSPLHWHWHCSRPPARPASDSSTPKTKKKKKNDSCAIPPRAGSAFPPYVHADQVRPSGFTRESVICSRITGGTGSLLLHLQAQVQDTRATIYQLEPGSLFSEITLALARARKERGIASNVLCRGTSDTAIVSAALNYQRSVRVRHYATPSSSSSSSSCELRAVCSFISMRRCLDAWERQGSPEGPQKPEASEDQGDARAPPIANCVMYILYRSHQPISPSVIIVAQQQACLCPPPTALGLTQSAEDHVSFLIVVIAVVIAVAVAVVAAAAFFFSYSTSKRSR